MQGTTLRIQGAKVLLLAVLLAIVIFTGVTVAGAATVEAFIPVEQTLTRITNSTGIDDAFDYRLVALSSTNPLPAGAVGTTYAFTLNGTEQTTLGPITFSAVGTYAYRIEPATGERRAHFTYDERVYDVTIHVRPVAAGLVADVIARAASGAKVDTIAYAVSYEALPTDRALMVDPPVRKTVSGNPATAATFTFMLRAADTAQPMPAGSVNGTKTLTITGSGEGEFGTWSYTQPGVYFYTVSEVGGGLSGYTYDKSVYTITDTITDEAGQLVLSRVVTNQTNQQVEALTFINAYSAKGIGDGKRPVDGPQTGDYSDPVRMITIMALSGLVACACLVYLISQKRTLQPVMLDR